MRPASPAFLAALRRSHVVVSTLELRFPDALETPVVFPVLDGSITLDRTALIRRTGSVTVPWGPAIGAQVAELDLDLRDLPFGGYAIPRRGIRFGDGTEELIDLGFLRVESLAWGARGRSAKLELADRMAQVRDEPFVVPFTPGLSSGVTRTGTIANGSNLITGLSDTSDLLPGMTVTGLGIPPGTTIVSIDSSSQVTMSNIASTLVGPLRVAGLPNNAVLTGIADTSDLIVGMTVNPVNNNDGQPVVRPGTTIASIDSSSQITMSQPTFFVTFWDGAPDPGEMNFTFSAPATQSLAFGGGTRLAQVAQDLVEEVFGAAIDYHVSHDPSVLASDVYYTQNRAESVVGLARAAGGDAYFDAAGDFVLEPAPDPSSSAVWKVDAGEEGVLVDSEEAITRTGAYNGVLVRGQLNAGEAPFSVLVTDDDPSSPTLWGGPFGKVARVEQPTTTVQTLEQATELATTLLAQGLGLQRTLDLSQAPNPALEPSDVVEVTFDDGRVENHVLDQLEVGLGASSGQKLSTRVAFTGDPLTAVFTGKAVGLELAGARLATSKRARARRRPRVGARP